MRSLRWLCLAVVGSLAGWPASACNLYSAGLLDDARGGPGPGTGGARSGGGGGDATGATGNGGAPSSGGTIGGGGNAYGGMGGDGDGGSGGGASGGNSSGGGGDGSGGDGSGGDGSGGAPPLPPIGLIDDFSQQGIASYNNAPFHGAWERYIQPGGTWAVTLTSAMVQARPDDAANFAIHVAATTLDYWGAGVLVTVNGGAAMDWTEVDGITFETATMNGEMTLRVAVADVNSHLPVCMTVNSGEDCDKHIRTAQVFAIDDTFTTIDLPMDTFTDKSIDGRVADLDPTAVYALHFQLDPVDDAVDYYIDNVETY